MSASFGPFGLHVGARAFYSVNGINSVMDVRVVFWVILAGLCVVALAPAVIVLWRGRVPQLKSAEQDMQVYRDQLSEVDRDLERGVLSAPEAATARTEVARRLLAADKRAQGEGGFGTGSGPLGVALVVFAGLGAVALYWQVGAAGLPDQGLAKRLVIQQEAARQRPSQQAAEETLAGQVPLVEVDPAFEALVEKLRDAVAQNPEDPVGLRLLADNEARLGNFVAARQAQARLLAVLGDKAKPSDHTDIAEMMIFAADGYVSPQASEALAVALRADPRDPRTRYYSGLSLAQSGRPDVAYRMWNGLLQEGPADAPWIPLIQSQIVPVARAAGISRAQMPQDQGLAGPSAQDIENAQDLSEEDRKDMIRNMVAGLADRLATEGGNAAEWARLIRAYGVLGETAKANAIWQEARTVFAQNPEALAMLREAAQNAEVAQ